MIEEIQKQLKALEQKEQLKILLAVESGSRAWGFPSPDSDYDVRIIYIRKQDWYLSIDDKKDTIEFFHGKLLDIGGWDIRKTLRLLRKSNATPFEWAQSPTIYTEVPLFRKALLNLANQFFQANHSLNHYKGIAKNSFLSNPEGQEIKLKKLFYVIRPLLAAKWIVERKSVPPMDIFSLMEVLENKAIEDQIRALIKTKADVNEDYVYSISPNIKAFIQNLFQDLESRKLDVRKETPSTEILNNFYRELLKTYHK